MREKSNEADQGPDSRLSIHLLRKTRPTAGECIAALDGTVISVPKLSWRFLKLNRFAQKTPVEARFSKPSASLSRFRQRQLRSSHCEASPDERRTLQRPAQTSRVADTGGR